MAKITVKSGGRGRPLSIDIDTAYDEILALLPKASARLKALRKSSSGMRSEAIFGTQTTVPDWVEQSLDIIDTAQSLDMPLTYKDVKDIKTTITTLKQLGSKQAKVYERALSEQLTQEYLDELEQFEKTSTSFAKEQIKQIRKKFNKLSKRGKQKFLTSKAYQSPKSKGRYKRVKDYAQAETGRANMTYQDAWAYLYKRRAEDGLTVEYIEGLM